jgi:HAD superfamily hydrolase (TIGR01484 family)
MRGSLKEKRVVIFDLDGTLAETKSEADREMIELILKLLETRSVAVIGGGKYTQFRRQLVDKFPRRDARLTRLFLFPTTATAFYRYRTSWRKVYAKELSLKERASAKRAFREVLKEIHYVPPKKTYGQIIEDRRSQVTFSALGQNVVAALGKKGIAMKEAWTRENTPIKLKIAKLVQKRLPRLEVRASGFTSIDITQKGIDKAYGVRQINKILKTPIKDMVFIGDALYPGGNDYAARKSGVECVPVRGPEDTKRIIRQIIAG